MSNRYKYAVDHLLAGVSTSTGQAYLDDFVAQLSELFPTDYAAIALLDGDHPDRLETLSMWSGGQRAENIVWSLPGSPGAEVIDSAAPCTFRSRVQDRFPDDAVVRRTGVQSYIGVPLFASSGNILGMIILMDRQSVADDLFVIDIVQLFADRIVAEIERLRTEPAALREQQQLEHALHHCRGDLHTARKELEAFTYAVSHDLRGPLRAIDGFSETLAVDYGDRLDDVARDYLQRIRNNARQLDQLINALLMLSRVTRHELRLSPVDLSQLCLRIIGRLQQRNPERKVTVRVQPNIKTYGDPELLATALEHLLVNAWKFTVNVAHARIEFSAEEQDGAIVYRLNDNGAGFNIAYANRLFEIFQRLHGHQTFEGIGAGLAIVKRIIDRHGGSVWAHGEVGGGASFYFKLPEQRSGAA
jgi:signal transduction histidine kinase